MPIAASDEESTTNPVHKHQDGTEDDVTLYQGAQLSDDEDISVKFKSGESFGSKALSTAKSEPQTIKELLR